MEASSSSANEVLIPPEESHDKRAEARLRLLFLPAKLFLVIIDIGICLWGIDTGFFQWGRLPGSLFTLDLLSFDLTAFDYTDISVALPRWFYS